MLRFFIRHRPSASMVIALAALSVALGGVGWAAFALPAHSVGTRQLKNHAVTSVKLRRGAVGNQQINTGQVQTRVTGTCANAAIGAINSAGGVTCNSAPPAEFGAGSGAVSVGTSSTTVVTKSLPAGSALLFANAYAAIPAAPTQAVPVSCTLSVSGTSLSAKRTVQLAPSSAFQQVAMPILAEVTVPSGGGKASVDCSQAPTPATPVPAVKVQSTIHAIETQANGGG